MKRKSLLFVMASVCLFSCQQQEELQDPSKEGINFLTTVDNESITDAVTRSSSNLSLPLKVVFQLETSFQCPFPSRNISLLLWE